jgi:hypothetical protein
MATTLRSTKMDAIATNVARAGPIIVRQSKRIACSRNVTEDKPASMTSGCTAGNVFVASVNGI